MGSSSLLSAGLQRAEREVIELLGERISVKKGEVAMRDQVAVKTNSDGTSEQCLYYLMSGTCDITIGLGQVPSACGGSFKSRIDHEHTFSPRGGLQSMYTEYVCL